MALFGISLKKIEAIPGEVAGGVANGVSDVYHGLDNAYHDVSNWFSGSSGGGSGGGNSGGGSFNGGGGAGRPVFNNYGSPQAPFQGPGGQNPPGIPRPNLTTIIQPQMPGYTPPGMKRDQYGNLVPANQPTGNDPVQNYVKQTFVKPVQDMAHSVRMSPVGSAIRLAAAEDTNNTAAIANAKQDLAASGSTLNPPPMYLDKNKQPTDTYQGASHLNPDFNAYINTVVMGADHGGLKVTGSPKVPSTPSVPKPSAPKPMASNDLDTLNNLNNTAKTRILTPEEKVQRASLQAQKDSITTPAAPADTPLPKTTAAAQRLNNLYDGNTIEADSTHNLINKAIGISRQFSDAGDQLQAAMRDELTPTERTAVRDTLEGQQPRLAKGDDPVKVQQVAEMAKQLSDKGYDVLDRSHKTDMHRVQQYATRLANFAGTKPIVGLANRGFNTVKSLFDIHSGFSRSRAIGKFAGADGTTKYGTRTDLGLKNNQNGDLVDRNGVVHTPQAVSTQELKQNGFNYEDDYGRIANAYHSSVGRVKVGLAAKEELLNNPERYGLVKNDGSVPVPKGYEPIRQVPELNGYLAPAKDAKAIDEHLNEYPHKPNLAERAYQGFSSSVIQPIVMNPIFHTRNLDELAGLAAGKAKNTPFGGALIKKAYLDLAQMAPHERAALEDRMNSAGVVKETYGVDHSTVLSNALDKAHLPHFNKAASGAMAHIDWNVRSALFHLVTTGGKALKDEEAAALVNRFLGDRAAQGPIGRNVGLFWRYFATRTNILKDTARHPIKNRGAIMTAATQAAVIYGATKAFQEWTGNKHASLGRPGIFGLFNDADTLAHGRPNATASSKFNPLIIAALNQLYGTDLYTGNKLSNAHARLTNAKETLFAPSQTTDKVSSGKQSPAQAAVQTLTGVSLPHTKGSPAIPNTNNPLATLVNGKNTKPAAAWGSDNDPTGIDQAGLYYKAKDAGLQATNGNPEATDLFNAYIDDEATSHGEKMKKSPAETMGVAEALSGSPTALEAVRSLEQANPNHDPMWDLSSADLKTFLKAEGNSITSGVKSADKLVDTDFNNGEGFRQFLDRRSAYYDQNKLQGTAKDNPETPQYPSFQGEQEADYNLYKSQYQNADSKTKSAWLAAHPDVVDAIQQVGKYFNDLGYAQTGLHTKTSVPLTAAQQQWYNNYQTLSKAERSKAIRANPSMWAAISSAFGQGDLVNLAQQGAVNQYAGVQWTPQFLKEAYNAGHYDIAPVQQADGSTSYAFNPPAASAANYASSSSSNTYAKARYAKGSSAKQEAAYQRLSSAFSTYRNNVKTASQARDTEHAAKAADSITRKVNKAAKLRGPMRLSVHMAGQTKVKPYKAKSATLTPRQINKKPAKTVKALTKSNRATLKA